MSVDASTQVEFARIAVLKMRNIIKVLGVNNLFDTVDFLENICVFEIYFLSRIFFE